MKVCLLAHAAASGRTRAANTRITEHLAHGYTQAQVRADAAQPTHTQRQTRLLQQNHARTKKIHAARVHAHAPCSAAQPARACDRNYCSPPPPWSPLMPPPPRTHTSAGVRRAGTHSGHAASAHRA